MLLHPDSSYGLTKDLFGPLLVPSSILLDQLHASSSNIGYDRVLIRIPINKRSLVFVWKKPGC